MIRLQTDISLPRRWWKIPDLLSASSIRMLRRYTSNRLIPSHGCLCVTANEAVIPIPTTDNTLVLRLRVIPPQLPPGAHPWLVKPPLYSLTLWNLNLLVWLGSGMPCAGRLPTSITQV